ncbi:MAG TPA: universal stress protein [Nitrospiria bacterium]|nr:universal stress protein [Nitrospiria bacterium]
MTGPAFTTLLVPTDFSQGAAAAVEYALWLAGRTHATVIFFHVMEPTVYSVDFALTRPDLSAEVRERAQDVLRQLVEEARGRGIPADQAVAVGAPFAEIRKAAADRRVDLIVMGTHGRTGAAHVVLGSTAERVVRLAPCPVLTVKASGKSTTGTPASADPAASRNR